MYESVKERNCCDEVRAPLRESETTCKKATRLLECLRHIDGMVGQISATLFCDDHSNEKFAEPNCLASNIDIAFEQARCIAAKLENIIARL